MAAGHHGTVTPMNALVIPSRFCGPPRSGNGGWTAGALAAVATGSDGPHPPVEVTLRQPPALETPLAVRHEAGSTLLEHDGALVAQAAAVAGDIGVEAVAAVDVATALAASTRHPGLGLETYAACFVCGQGRSEGDGLRIFPGPIGVSGQDAAEDVAEDRVAAAWTPHPSTSGTFSVTGVATPGEHADLACTWGALDCIGGWADDMVSRPMLLGRMTAQVSALPRVGEEHVLVGRLLRRDGRRSYTASTLYTAEGRELARAHHVWFAVDLSAYS